MSKIDLKHFETVIVYKSLTDPVYLASIINFVKPIYFKDKDIKSIFTIVKQFYENRGVAPTATEIKTYLTTDELKASFKTVVTNLQNVDKNLDKEELYSNTEQFLKENAVYHTMMGVTDEIVKGSVDTAKILQEFDKACNISLTTDKGLDLFENIDKLVENLNTVVKHIPSKWSWLDEKLDGGFLESGRALYIFTGETNIGKSIFLGNLAVNIANQGKSVLLVTLEMPELIYAQRLSSSITKIPLGKLKSEISTLQNQLTEHANSNTNAKILIKEFPPSTITPLYLKSYIQELQRMGYKFDAIVVDYVNLLSSPIGTNSYERIKYATEQLRAMSYTFNCPIISATQLNRSGYSVSNPTLNMLSESMGLGMTADAIFSIWQEDTDRELGKIRMGAMKNRFGANSGSCIMRIDYSTLTIYEDEHVNDTEASSSSAGLLAALSQ
jgi:replicative DNA helicase